MAIVQEWSSTKNTLTYYFSSLEFYGFYLALIILILNTLADSKTAKDFDSPDELIALMKMFLIPIFSWGKIMDGWQKANEKT